MLNKIRENSNNVFVKAILFFLVFIFIFWGVGDIFRKRNVNEVAKVGNSSISVDRYKARLKEFTSYLSQVSGKEINEDFMKQNGIYQAVLQGLILNELYYLEAKNNDIILPEEYLIQKILEIPFLQDSEGKFSKERLDFYLSNMGLTESQLLEEQKKQEMTNILLKGLTEFDFYDQNYAEMVFNFREEKRVIDLIYLDYSHIKSQKAPTNNELLLFYDKNKEKLKTEERRDVRYIEFSCSKMQQNSKIDMAKINEQYERNRNYYEQNNISFDEARKTIERDIRIEGSCNLAKEKFIEFSNKVALNKSISLDEIAKQTNLDISSSLSVKNGSADHSTQINSKVFSISQSDVGKTFSLNVNDEEKGVYGYLVTVDKINPSRIPDIEEVRGSLMDLWKIDNEKQKTKEFLDKFVENNKGKDSQAIINDAKKLGFRIVSNQQLDRNNSIKLPEKMTVDIFSLIDKNKISSVYEIDNEKKFAVAVLRNVVISDKNIENGGEKYLYSLKEFGKTLNDIRKSELVDQYNKYLEKKYKIVINVNFNEQ